MFSKVWEGKAAYGDYPSVAIAEGVVFGVPRDGKALALDLATGETRWAFEIGKAPVYAPCLAGDVVVFGADKVCHAVDRATGAPRWSAPLYLNGLMHPVAADDRVFVREFDKQRVVALDRASGREVWSRELPSMSTVDYAQMHILDGALIACHGKGIAWLDPATGTVRREVEIAKLTTAVPDGTDLVAVARSVPARLHVLPRDGSGTPRPIVLERRAEGIEIGFVDRIPAIASGWLHAASEEWQVRFSVEIATGAIRVHEKATGFGPFAACGANAFVVQSARKQPTRLRVFDAATGADRWSAETKIGSPAFTSIHPHEGGVVVVGESGIIAFRND